MVLFLQLDAGINACSTPLCGAWAAFLKFLVGHKWPFLPSAPLPGYPVTNRIYVWRACGTRKDPAPTGAEAPSLCIPLHSPERPFFHRVRGLPAQGIVFSCS